MLYYTGAGARITPFSVCQEMVEIATLLNESGYRLRSGLAKRGADVAFKLGSNGNCDLFDPNGINFKIPEDAYEIAKRHHVAWDWLRPFHKDLMARNVMACLGPTLDNPSAFLLCWTNDGIEHPKDRTKRSGGTGHTISVAHEFGIPICNMAKRDVNEFLKTYIKGWHTGCGE